MHFLFCVIQEMERCIEMLEISSVLTGASWFDNLKHLLSKTLDETTILLRGRCLNSQTLRTRNLQHDILLTVCVLIPISHLIKHYSIPQLFLFFLLLYISLYLTVSLLLFLLTFLSACHSSLPWRIIIHQHVHDIIVAFPP